MPRAMVLSRARPVKSWAMAKLESQRAALAKQRDQAAHGLAAQLWEDHSEALRDLACRSAARATVSLWTAAPGVDPFDLQIAVARARPGYFLLIARPV
ncbi:MAG: hypothetical protein HGA45_42790 [Chloroflexales bacterium]|nr:hypothetical protein [Chloroflexales bacterium]